MPPGVEMHFNKVTMIRGPNPQSMTSLSVEVNARAFNTGRDVLLRDASSCTAWAVEVHFDLSSHGSVSVSLRDPSGACEQQRFSWSTPLILLSLVAFALAVLHQVTVLSNCASAWALLKVRFFYACILIRV